AGDCRVPEQVRPGGRRGAVGPGGAGGARAAEQVRVPGGRRAGDPGVGLEGDCGGQGVGGEGGRAAGGLGQEHSGAEAGGGEAVPDAGGGRVFDHGPGHGGDGADRAGQGKGGRGSGDGRCWDGQEGGGGGGGGVEQVDELLAALDKSIPVPKREVEKPFLMPVEDVFSITGRGTVATGRIERGKVKVGEEVEMVGFGTDKKVVVTGVEMFRKLLDEGQAGDNVGLLLRGIEKHEVERGMVLAKPKSITPHTQFESEVYVLTKEEGGRHTPFF